MRTITGVPESVTYEQVAEFLHALGMDPQHVREFRVHPKAIEAEVYALDENGRRYARGNAEVAVDTVHIPIVRGGTA